MERERHTEGMGERGDDVTVCLLVKAAVSPMYAFVDDGSQICAHIEDYYT